MHKLLLEWSVSECLQNKQPMHYAAKKGDVEAMRELISRGYLVNCVNEEQGRVTPLHEASTHGHSAAVKFLIEEGAWVDARNIDGATPLVDACSSGHRDIASILIEHGAQINSTIYGPSSSPLHEAAYRNHAACVELLLAKGAKLDVNDRQYGTPLHAACHGLKTNAKIVLILLQAGADVNATFFHKTPLHIASTKNCVDAVQLLLIYGANVFMQDSDGKRPSQRAKPPIKRLLLPYETKPRSLSECCRISILQYYVVGKRLRILKDFGLPRRIEQYIFSHKL